MKMPLFSRLRRALRMDRRATVAVVMAIMVVPLFIAGNAAVDLSRIVTARTILQAAADSAAIAGAGAWQTSESGTTANQVASQAFSAQASTIANYAPLASGSPSLSLVCTGTSTQCGSGTYATSNSNPACVNYCVIVNASVTLNNTLFALLANTTTVSVTAGAAVAFPPEQVTGADIPPSPGFGSAGDHSDIYAYAVPPSVGGGSNSYNYNGIPAPNQDCNSSDITGVLSLLPETNQTGATACNYLFVADSESAGTSGAGGSITLQPGQPIAFAFIDDTGGNGYTGTGGTYTTQLVISETYNGTTVLPATYYPNGNSVNVYTTSTTTDTCSSGHLTNSDTSCSGNGNYNTTTNSTTATSGTVGSSSGCTSGTTSNCQTYKSQTVTEAGVAASASCPAETLYGALSSGYGAPVADNIDEYSSAPEVMGYPPTYLTNHPLVPFVSTVASTTALSDGHTFTVKAICPNYSLSGTSINASIANSYVTALANYYTPGSATYGGSTIANINSLNINVYSTAFPGQTFMDSTNAPAEDVSGMYNGTSAASSPTELAMTTGVGDVYPPAIAGCTPATSAEDGGATTTNPWWNWDGSNASDCSNEATANTTTYLGSGQPAYGDCTLVVQRLGTAVPTISITPTGGSAENEAVMPDYYLVISTQPPASTTSSTVVALDPVWDGRTFTDVLGSVITNHLGGVDSSITVSGSTVTDADTAPTFSTTGAITSYGFVPTSTNDYHLTSGTYSGDYVIVEQPATNGKSGGTAPYDFNPPAVTSHQCYDPQKNGNAAGSAVMQEGGGKTTTYTTLGDQNTGATVDPVANPQLGAIICNSSPPETYALYWNDLGTYGSDDLGYWNAEVSFTCPVPGSLSGGGPVALFE